jgi:lysophospholipase L1-like esterase
MKTNRRELLVACVGASIVRGNVSFNFVDLLKGRLERQGFRFINAGVNGDLAYNVLKRLDSVINLQPDFVTILVGTNDVIATTSRMAEINYKLTKALPRKPTLDWYRENLEAIISNLQQRTSAKIALSSLPVLGEDLSSEPNQKIDRYNGVIRETAEKYRVNYLPVNESQVKLLRSIQSKPGRAFKGTGLMTRAILRHFLLRQGFDEISEKNGLLLTTDCIHMNSKGGTIIADQIETFLQSCSTSKKREE